MPGLFSSVCSCLFTVVLCCDLLALHLAGVTFMTFFFYIHSPLVVSLTCVLFGTIMNEATGNTFCRSFCAYVFISHG